VVEDLRLGYVSAAKARSEYGVVFDLNGKIDTLATQDERNRTSEVEKAP
jgi:hypothetical protein